LTTQDGDNEGKEENHAEAKGSVSYRQYSAFLNSMGLRKVIIGD